LTELKDAHKAQDVPRIETAMAALNEAWTAASQDLYNAMNQNGEGQPGADAGAGAGAQGAGTGETVTDAEFEEVK